jgi:hypothetical protein
MEKRQQIKNLIDSIDRGNGKIKNEIQNLAVKHGNAYESHPVMELLELQEGLIGELRKIFDETSHS